MPETMKDNKKKLWVLLGVVAVVIIIIIVAASSSKTKTGSTPNGGTATTQNGSQVAAIPTPVAEPDAVMDTVVPAAPVVVDIKEARVEIPGASLITPDNKVVTEKGVIAKNDVIPASAEAPKSAVIAKEDLPKSAINIDVKDSKFSPAAFSVKPGQPVSFAVTSADGQVHVVIFGQAELGAIAMGIGPGQTKAITFNAPMTAGDFEFRCDVPGHRAAGEVGKMIVK